MMRKGIRKIHRWLGVAFGVIITVSCLTGAVLVWLPRANPAYRTVFRLHRWLMDTPASRGDVTWGKILIGISTLALVIILITGIILWLKPARKHFWRSLGIQFSEGKKVVRDLHVALGVWTALFLLLMALTGLTWSFGWFRDAVYGLFGWADPQTLRHTIRALHTGTAGGTVTQCLWFAAALLGASLPVTGYILWAKRLKKKTDKKKHKKTKRQSDR